MKTLLPVLVLTSLAAGSLQAADPAPAVPAATPAAKPTLKIIPGQVIVPTDAMRRIWGELISMDLKTRTGKFRKEGTDEVMSFTVMPYAELLHHATYGDLQDFRIGERAIFRLHENSAGEWVWLTYIQDQMNMMNGHKEYFYVDSIDAAKGELNCTQANFDKSFVREKGIPISTDKETRYWKGGQPAKFEDIKVGDKIRTKTHGVGKGKVQMCWEVFLDDESLAKFQNEQKAVHAERMERQGAPGYVDKTSDRELELTLFQEGEETMKKLKVGQNISVAPAGMDREPTMSATTGTVSAIKAAGKLGKLSVTLDTPAKGFEVAGLARVWAGK